MKRSGFADLPLHGGRVPSWLADHMTKLGAANTEAILLQYGRSEFYPGCRIDSGFKRSDP